MHDVKSICPAHTVYEIHFVYPRQGLVVICVFISKDYPWQTMFKSMWRVIHLVNDLSLKRTYLGVTIARLLQLLHIYKNVVLTNTLLTNVDIDRRLDFCNGCHFVLYNNNSFWIQATTEQNFALPHGLTFNQHI